MWVDIVSLRYTIVGDTPMAGRTLADLTRCRAASVHVPQVSLYHSRNEKRTGGTKYVEASARLPNQYEQAWTAVPRILIVSDQHCVRTESSAQYLTVLIIS